MLSSSEFALSRATDEQRAVLAAMQKVMALREKTGTRAAEMFNVAHEIPTREEFSDVCRKIGLVNGLRDAQAELVEAIKRMSPRDQATAMCVADKRGLFDGVA